MPLDFNDLKQVPEFCALLEEVSALRKEVAELRKRHAVQWVTDKQAQQITGLSRDTLRRARKAADSVIIYKEDHGLRYDYDSLLAHSARKAIGRSRLAQLLHPTSAKTIL